MVERQPSLRKYLAACRDYQVVPCSDVLTCLRLARASLSLHRYRGSRAFGELELHPLVEVLEEDGEALGRLRTLDLSGAQLGPSGAVLVSRLLALPQCALEVLNLSRQRPGVEGTAALVEAVRGCKSLKVLRIKSCHFGDEGGMLFATLLEQGQAVHGLSELDLQNNWLTFDGCQCIKRACRGQQVRVDLSGNMILDEVLNAVSHGLGCVLAIVGSVFMGFAVLDKPTYYTKAVVLYSVALHVLYFASTLFHSFHALGPKVLQVFGILDHCAIYLLIAGSYCPFLWILLPEDPRATRLLLLLWGMALAGMATTAFYSGKGKGFIETCLYLVMGWSCVTCLGDMMRRLGPDGSRLLVIGGLLYTGGVPFFVKAGRTWRVPDHTIWHLFVLAGSIAHYFCILWYCLEVPSPSPTLQ